MRAFHLAYPDAGPSDRDDQSPPAIVPQRVPPLPWGHTVILLEKVKDPTIRGWYADRAVVTGAPILVKMRAPSFVTTGCISAIFKHIR
jgi:hypothetical protein